MSLLHAQDVVKHYGGDTVLEGVTLSISRREKVGLVGPNGAGKSTLLRLLADLEAPDGGQIFWARGARVGYLSQHVQIEGDHTIWSAAAMSQEYLRDLRARLAHAQAQVASPETYGHDERLSAALDQYARLSEAFERAGGYEEDVWVRTCLFGLGFRESDLERKVSTLSGGQLARVGLAQLLLARPDILLLDEPTNHLDIAAVEWLESFLQQTDCAVVVVSHDRVFLDRVVERIWELEAGRVIAYDGNYTAYARQRAERLARHAEAYAAQQAEIAQLEAFIRRYKAGNRSAQAKSREKWLAHMDRIAPPPQSAAEQKPVLRFGTVTRTGREVVNVQAVSHHYGGAPVLENVNLVVERGQRVGIIGPNGAGKTTLLSLMAGRIAPASGEVVLGHQTEVGYFSQSLIELDEENTVLEELLDVRNLPLGEARSLLARFLFRGEDVFKRVAVLSGGERSRLALACLLLSEPNVLFLDEPTNHLDMAAREALEEACLAYPGTLIFVSHDRYFLEKLAQRIVVVQGGRATVYEGSYAEYRNSVRNRGPGAEVGGPHVGPGARAVPGAHMAPGAQTGGAAGESIRTARSAGTGRTGGETAAESSLAKRDRDRQKERQEQAAARRRAQTVAALEVEIAEAEAQVALLAARLADPALYQDADEARRVVAEHRALAERIEALYAAWEAAAQ